MEAASLAVNKYKKLLRMSNDCAGGGKRLEMVYNFMVLRVSAVLLMCQITIPDKAQNEEASSNKIKVSTPNSA